MNVDKIRAEAEAILDQAQAQLGEIDQALSAAIGSDAFQGQLRDLHALIAGSAAWVSQALKTPGATVSPTDLAILKAIVCSDKTTSLIAQVASQIGASAAQLQAVAAASAATRATTQSIARDMFEGRIFDAYLHFASPEDEEEYRRREAEARKYVEGQLARHTPEGDLNAGGGMLGAMLDAHAHGAGDSPEFLPRWNELVEKTQQQRAAMRSAGQSTDEYDHNLTASVRRFLKEKHLSDAEIDERLARSANPLDAVKPFLKNDHASRNLETTTKAVGLAAHSAPSVLPAVEVAQPAPFADTSIPADFDPFAKLKAAGVQVTDTSDSGHGVSLQKLAAKDGPTVVS